MISMIKKRTKNYPLVSALLLVVILAFAFMLMVGLALICNSGAEASGPPILGDIEVGSKVSEDGAYETTLLEPHISVYPQFYYIDGENWPADIAINLKIRDGEGGALLFESDTVSDGGGYFFFHFWNDPDRVELSPGQYVIIEDADGTIKTHLVKDLIITDVDMANDKVYGAAESIANTVLVEIRGDYIVNPVETATFTGVGTKWEADFSAVGIDYSTVAHLRAAELDDDGNRTYQYWGPPHFFIDHHADDLWGYGWSEDGEITVQITYADASEETPFIIETSEYGDFWVNLRDDYGYYVAAGDVLELTQGLATLTHTIMDLNIENIDPVNDTVSGTADPNYDVTVEIHGHDPDYYVKASRTETPETDGTWIAEFNPADIEPGSSGSAEQFYDLSASTRVHWHLPMPFFMVDPYHNDIWGHHWPAETELTVTIGDPGSPAWSENVTTDEEGNLFDLWDIDYNIQAGNLVTVTDGEDLIKEHIVTNLRDIEVDPENDIVSGLADPNTPVEVHIHHHGDYHIGRTVEANDQGYWETDFSVPGSEPHDQVIYDIKPGSSGAALQRDGDGETRINWNLGGVHRLSGANRYVTAVEISKSAWDSAETVILARGDDFADALAGVPLAYHLDAPILLTPTAGLHSATEAEIERLGAANVILLGGTAAISNTVKGELESKGLGVERIAGSNRYHTAALIAYRLSDEGVDFDTAFIAVGTNFADALAASSYAARRGEPILLTGTNTLPDATSKAITDLGILNTYVCGGTAAVSGDVFSELPNPKRIFGANRYATALALAGEFLPDGVTHVGIATGLNFPDAIAGGVWAAKQNTGILLVDGSKSEPSTAVQNFITDRGITGVTLFGGSGAVSSAMEAWFEANLGD